MKLAPLRQSRSVDTATRAMLLTIAMRDKVPDKVTMGDIARASGVSPMTVSRVLSNNPAVKEASRKRVLAVTKRLNYHVDIVARQLRAQHTFQLGVVVPFRGLVGTYYFGQILQGIQQVLTGPITTLPCMTAFLRTSTIFPNASISATSAG